MKGGHNDNVSSQRRDFTNSADCSHRFNRYRCGGSLPRGENLDRIAEVAITQGMSFILNVPVKLDKADIDLKSGSIELDNLVIENPRGFQQERAFSLGRIYVQADVNSFRSDLPVINRITIEDPQITLEYGLKGSNFDQLIENANRFSRQGKRGRESGSAKERKKAQPEPRRKK